MVIWIIADTHFYHKNIIKYCDRPFKNVQDMNKKIIENWNKRVKKNDIVLHLGDFAFKNVIETRKKLNGIIILIKGNHDYKIRDNSRILIVEGNLIIGNYIFSHRPLEMDNIPDGFINVHGHIHEKESFNGINVSVERTNYFPILYEDLILKS